MVVRNGKTNWPYLAVVFIFAVASGSVAIFLENKWVPEYLPSTVPIVLKRPVPLPTAIDPNFLTQVNECFIPTAAVYGYNLQIMSGFRTVAEQDQLYQLGRTVDGNIVTDATGGHSMHNYGLAVDVADRWRKYNINFVRLAKIGVFCGLENPDPEGDPLHFEHRDGLTTDQLAAGARPAPLVLPCPIMDDRAKARQVLTLRDLQSCGAPAF